MKNKQLILLAIMIASLTACGSDSETTAPTSPDAPVLSAIGDKTVLQGTELSFNITATDPNGDNLVFDAAATGATDPRDLTSSPAVFSTNQSSATFTWTPGMAILGDYPMKFTVTDDSAKTLTDSETMTITVVDTLGQGRILYRDNCGDCHGFEGTAGTATGPVFARDASVIVTAFTNSLTMGIADTKFTPVQLNMIIEYLCDVDPSNCV